ncbi:MAG: phytanoyl-CoA dioxygenase [Bacilli bacterium]|nr:phytanoyl-CoA dioxygenase [Bacilli bacterium]
MNQNEAVLLTDEQMRQFITEGFLILKTDFAPEFHQQLVQQLDQVYEEEGNPGNNLLPRIREMQKVFENPVIQGALTSVLGPNYMMHTHRHGHRNNTSQPGSWHKDSYWGYKRMRNHHPWWAMIMYFPQDTPAELGPTGVMPGTQNYNTRIFESDESDSEATAKGAAGTFALIHYDIWHRSTPNVLGKNRYMLKFEFMRTQAPQAPSWNNQVKEWVTPASFSAPIIQHEALWRETWNWLSGQAGRSRDASLSASEVGDSVEQLMNQLKQEDQAARAAAADKLGLLGTNALHAGAVEALASALEDSFEPVALNAAYGLSRMGQQGIDSLLQALTKGEVSVSRTAAYGLSASGKQAVSGLIQSLGSKRAETVAHAVFALGELRQSAAEAVPALISLLTHEAQYVRHEVVEALGNIGTPSGQIVAALTKCLQDPDTQVRFMTGLSLAKLGSSAEDAVPQLITALDDENRYVRGHAAEALKHIGTSRAKDALINFLLDSRWCPTTTPASTFYP